MENNQLSSYEKMKMIIDGKPITKLESYVFYQTREQLGNESHMPDCCYFTDKGDEAFSQGKWTETFVLKLNFKDEGAPLAQHYVSFDGRSEIFNDDTGDDYVFDISPELLFTPIADKDGRFSVMLYLFTEECEDDYRVEPKDMKNMRVIFSDINVANQFVSEKFNLDCIMDFSDEGKLQETADVEKSDITLDVIEFSNESAD